MSTLQAMSSSGRLGPYPVYTTSSHRGGQVISTSSKTVHPAFLHPLYTFNTALFSAAAAACTGMRASGSNSSSSPGKQPTKSFTIDAILGTVTQRDSGGGDMIPNGKWNDETEREMVALVA